LGCGGQAGLSTKARLDRLLLIRGADRGTAHVGAGLAIVQDPDEAIAPSMPRSALAYVEVDYTVSVTEMGPLLGRLAAERIQQAAEDRIAVLEDMPDEEPMESFTDPAGREDIGR